MTAKRALDLAGSLLLLLVLTPLLLGVAAGVAASSPGGVLRRERRAGLAGREFQMLAFRTTRTAGVAGAGAWSEGAAGAGGEAEADTETGTGGETGTVGTTATTGTTGETGTVHEAPGVSAITEGGAGAEPGAITPYIPHSRSTPPRDPLLTPLGRRLRRLGLDGLPQLINVVRGEMSLVGPRPLPATDENCRGEGRRRLSVRPGMTGLWQVSGRSELPWEEMTLLDLHYVDQHWLGMDLAILARTLPALRGRVT